MARDDATYKLSLVAFYETADPSLIARCRPLVGLGQVTNHMTNLLKYLTHVSIHKFITTINFVFATYISFMCRT